MTLGSLFDGAGTCPLAATLCGITPLWASEIEKYPISVTTARFPDMLHLGDITLIDGAKVPPVDIVTFGSPCQDMSVAGTRAGLDGKRSSLFYEATRIIKEMRNATNDRSPRYIMWENVPGAFSSGKGEDFRAVLEEICSIAGDTISIPKPAKGEWATAGEIVADDYSVAWRTLDAQYWGVPQRRRRIYLVADLGGQRAPEILFEREGLSGHLAPGRTAREDATADTLGGVDRGVGDGRGGVVWPDIARTLSARYDSSPCIDRGQNVIALQGNGIDRSATAGCNDAGWREDVNYTLNTIDRHGVVYPTVAGCLSATTSRMVQTGERCNAVVFNAQAYDRYRETDIASTLRARCQKDATDLCVYDSRGYGDGMHANTLTGDHGDRVTDYSPLAIMAHGQANAEISVEHCPTLNCNHEQPIIAHSAIPPRKYIVRRLTPLECCRLQGMPDWWVDGVQGSDSAEYRMWGNGMALPCVLYVMQGFSRR